MMADLRSQREPGDQASWAREKDDETEHPKTVLQGALAELEKVYIGVRAEKTFEGAFEGAVEGAELSELLGEYGYQVDAEGHGAERGFKEGLEAFAAKKSPDQESRKSFSERCGQYLRRQTREDIGLCIARGSPLAKPGRILVIDDKPELLRSDFSRLVKLFACPPKIEFVKPDQWQRFLDPVFLRGLADDPVAVLDVDNADGESDRVLAFEAADEPGGDRTFRYDFVLVDLVYFGRREGNRIVRELMRFRHYAERLPGIRAVFDLVVLSLSQEVVDVQRALEEGALDYVAKRRILQLPAVIASLDEQRRLLKGALESSLAKSRNLGKLYQLPPAVRRELQVRPFIDGSPENHHEPALRLAYDWIRGMPKAELHCHLGGAMDAETNVHLALNTLRHLCDAEIGEPAKKGTQEILLKYVRGLERSRILELLDPPWKVQDWFEEHTKNNGDIRRVVEDAASQNGETAYSRSMYRWVTRKLGRDSSRWLKEVEEQARKAPEELFLSFVKADIEAGNKIPRDREVTEDDFVCILLVMLGQALLSEEAIRQFWQRRFVALLGEEGAEHEDPGQGAGGGHGPVSGSGTASAFLAVRRRLLEKHKPNATWLSKTLKDLLGANHSKNVSSEVLAHRVLAELLAPAPLSKPHKRDLSNYLRASPFSGGGVLQYPENIVAAVAGVLERFSADNTRYLELRVAPGGYCDKDLSLQDAVNALFDGADLMSWLARCRGRPIWVNFIFSGKRHKSPDALAIEVAAAVTNRSRQLSTLQSGGEKSVPRGHGGPAMLYDWRPSRVAGFDLTGREVQEDLSRYAQHFLPLYRTCSNITVHAGEQTSAEYIWQAVYLLHAQRIGHGLSLRDNEFLKRLVRDRQVCVELCPVSNMLTNPHLRGDYPLYDYVKEGIQCAICTDDPVWSGMSDLSTELVKAAVEYQGSRSNTQKRALTRWETLRLLKHSFKHAFLDRHERRNLLWAVEEEVYQLILQQEGFEPQVSHSVTGSAGSGLTQ